MWHRERCCEWHYIFGLFLTMAAVTLFGLGTFSVPYNSSIDHLRIGEKRYGPLGYCGPAGCERGVEVNKGLSSVSWLWTASILVPISFGLNALTLLVLLAHMASARVCEHHLWFRLTAGVAFIVSAVAAGISTAQFKKVSTTALGGDKAQTGPGIYLVIFGAVASLLAYFIGGPPYNGRYMYRANPGVSYDV